MHNYRNIQRSQSGFTLIELVMVIVILGILAATALPKFVDLATDARAGAMQGVKASMQAANTMLYAKAAAQNKTGATGNVTVSGVVGGVDLVYGYAKNTTELVKVMDLSGDFTNDAALGANGGIKHTKATTPANCFIGYTQSAGAGSAPAYADPTDCS